VHSVYEATIFYLLLGLCFAGIINSLDCSLSLFLDRQQIDLMVLREAKETLVAQLSGSFNFEEIFHPGKCSSVV